MNIHTETLDQTFEMRLLTDAELNDVNGGVVALIVAMGIGWMVGMTAACIVYSPDGPTGDVYWPAA